MIMDAIIEFINQLILNFQQFFSGGTGIIGLILKWFFR